MSGERCCLDCYKHDQESLETGIRLTKERIVRELNQDAVVQLNVSVDVLEHIVNIVESEVRDR